MLEACYVHGNKYGSVICCVQVLYGPLLGRFGVGGLHGGCEEVPLLLQLVRYGLVVGLWVVYVRLLS